MQVKFAQAEEDKIYQHKERQDTSIYAFKIICTIECFVNEKKCNRLKQFNMLDVKINTSINWYNYHKTKMLSRSETANIICSQSKCI